MAVFIVGRAHRQWGGLEGVPLEDPITRARGGFKPGGPVAAHCVSVLERPR